MTELFPTVVFDTETTGLPLFKLPADDPAQPRICQLAAVLIDPDWESASGAKPINPLINSYDAIIRPDGWTIPDEVARIHGITTERAMAEGVPIREALERFMALWERAAVVAAYGIRFDTKLLRGELRRAGFPDRFGEKPECCVMEIATAQCRLAPTDAMMATNRRHSKTAKLSEAVRILLGREHDGAHNAIHDCTETARLYWRFAKNGLVKPKKRESTRTATPASATVGDEAF